jgi:Matrixin
VALARTVAERFWGATPCGGQIAVLTERPLPSDLDATTDGWVTFNSSLGPNDLQAPASTYTQCTISLARWQWPTQAAMENDWNMFCLTVIHEVGHLLGHPHSLTPGSVMAPVFSDESSVPPICRATGPSARLAARPLRR